MAIAHSSRTMTLPVEIWREIIRLATTAPDSLSSSNLNAGEAMIEFNWPSNLPCRMPCPDSFSTKHALALTSYQFWQLSCEFLYETIYIRNVEHARYLASSPALQGALGKWTKNIIITPVFEDDISHTKFSPLAREFGNAVVRVLACCTKLQSVVVRADAVSKRLVLYEQWMKICSAVPQGVRHLDIDDDIFAPSRWEPFGKKNNFNFLCSMRLTTVRDTRDYCFTNMSHLALYSWPIASKWHMPSLTHLYITYFSNSPCSSTFWITPKPNLELLHFGHETDLSVFPELAQLVCQATPNVRALEYYYGSSEMSWDPSCLPESLKEVTIKTFHVQSGCKRGQLDVSFSEDGSRPGLTPAVAEKWATFARHLASYAVRPTVLVPRGVPLDCLRALVDPILTEHGAEAFFAESP